MLLLDKVQLDQIGTNPACRTRLCLGVVAIIRHFWNTDNIILQCVHHDRAPRVTGSNTKKGQEGSSEIVEVCVQVDTLTLVLARVADELAEKLHAQSRENKE